MWRRSKMSSRTPAQGRSNKIIINSSKNWKISLIFEWFINGFKLNRFQQKIKQSSLKAGGYHHCHQGHHHKSWWSESSSNPTSTPKISSIFGGVLNAINFNRFQPNLKHSSLRACGDHPKCLLGHHPKAGTSKLSSIPTRTLEWSSIF